jgi:hypothetical protein
MTHPYRALANAIILHKRILGRYWRKFCVGSIGRSGKYDCENF